MSPVGVSKRYGFPDHAESTRNLGLRWTDQQPPSELVRFARLRPSDGCPAPHVIPLIDNRAARFARYEQRSSLTSDGKGV